MKLAILTALVTASSGLIIATAAFAHAEITPEKVAAHSLTRLTLEVENERAHAQTVKVVVKMPAKLIVVQFAAKPGWKRTATTRRLGTPIKVEGRTIRKRVDVVSWTATSRAARFGPGEEHGHFTFSVFPLASTGQTLVLPTLQTYSNNEVVRWIGSAGSDTPAPRITVR